MKNLMINQKVMLYGHEGRVKRFEDKYYLTNSLLWRDILFSGSLEAAEKYSEELLGYNEGGDFPYCRSLEDLTKLVNALKVREEELKSAEDNVAGEKSNVNTTIKELTWKGFALKEMYAAYIGMTENHVKDILTEEGFDYKKLKELNLTEVFLEEVLAITIDGTESYVRKSEVEKLNLIVSM